MGGGSYGQIFTEGVASGPLIKHILDVRLAGSFERDEGWIINALNNQPINDHIQGNGRFAFSFHPLDNLSADYNLLLYKAVGGGESIPNGPTLELNTPAGQAAGGLPKPLNTNQVLLGKNPWKTIQILPLKGDTESTQNDGTIKWDFAEWGYLKSITAFQEHTIGHKTSWGSLPLDIFTNGRMNDDKAFTQELNLGGSSEIPWWKTNQPLTWITGAYYMHENYVLMYGGPLSQDGNSQYVLYDESFRGSEEGREKLNDYSVFGDVTIPLPWNFTLFGGVRYTYDKKALNETVTGCIGTKGPCLKVPTTCNHLELVDGFHNVSERVGMGWAAN